MMTSYTTQRISANGARFTGVLLFEYIYPVGSKIIFYNIILNKPERFYV